MAKNRQNIDHVFRQYLPDYELSEPKGNWDLLNHLLNEQDRKSKKRKWIFLFLGLSLFLLAGWIVLHLNLSESSPTIKSEVKNLSDSPLQSPQVQTERNAEALNSRKQIELTAEPPITAKRFDETPSSGNQLLRSKLDGINNQVNLEKENQTSKKNKGNDVFNSNGQQSQIVMPSNATIQTSPIIHPSSIVDSSQGDIINRNSESLLIETQSIPEAKAPILLKEKDSPGTFNTHKEILDPNQVLLDSTYATTLPKDSLPFVKSDTQLLKSTIDQLIIPTDIAPKKFHISTGLNIYNTSDAYTNKQNVAPLVGLEYTYQFAQRWFVGLGVWYSPQGGYKLKDTATQETYFFDRVVSQQAIHIHRLHKLYFPLSFYCKISKMHIMAIGIQPSYLLNTSGNYTEIKHSTSSSNESNENNVSGYMDGIKPVNLSMHIAYKYNLSSRLDLGLRLSHELTSAYEREYFSGINTKPSWTLQTLIQFNF